MNFKSAADVKSYFDNYSFEKRHIGPQEDDVQTMLKDLGFNSLDALIEKTIPKKIRARQNLRLPEARNEEEVLETLADIAAKNKIFRSFIGMGYSNTWTPAVIQRNILENPGWYTQYTPYQAEISQGRLEALMNFQTLITDLTGLEVANSSLLDEATAAAEAMTMCYLSKGKTKTESVFFVSELCHPQTIAVVKTRAHWANIAVVVGNHETYAFEKPVFGALLQYPCTDGTVKNYKGFIEKVHGQDGLVAMACDLLSLTLLTPPGELGADMALGNSQRFGVPMGFGGPHAAFLSTKDAYKRLIPGRIVGASKDAQGRTAFRLALQTREQHIRRDKASSNICTAQVLLAIMASMYAVYHGPKGLKKIAERIHLFTAVLAAGLKRLDYDLDENVEFFDCLKIGLEKKDFNSRDVLENARTKQINLRALDGHTVCVSLDETTTLSDIKDLLSVFSIDKKIDFTIDELISQAAPFLMKDSLRRSEFLKHPVFNSYHSETEMLRYISKLQAKDLSLAQSMIPLGSCTMKLNATTEMLPVTWPAFSSIHPFVPAEQASGYHTLIEQLQIYLAEITGFAAISMQPNAGSQGEYAGLLVIRKYLESKGEGHRNICLIPKSAHGTNPASAVMAGLQVVAVDCDNDGNVDLSSLKKKIAEHEKNIAALMVTYPSTHGVFEESISEISELIHAAGGLVYMDGANMNALVGLCRPGEFGPDVCHLNLHKTFCIPHGGGGPGMGPIGVTKQLASFLPNHPVVNLGMQNSVGAVSAAPWGSPSILTISWVYISLMGEKGLSKATKTAILNANYLAKKLESHFPILYKGTQGLVAHECILDIRPFKASAGIEPQDIAKRLMDYGFHAPTVSFPVAGTLMIEPTESESKYEIDRFIEAMISIRAEIAEIEKGTQPKENNLLKNAPHTALALSATEWTYTYTRERAAFPSSYQKSYKFWPSVGRINEVLGDRELICTCPPMSEYT